MTDNDTPRFIDEETPQPTQVPPSPQPPTKVPHSPWTPRDRTKPPGIDVQDIFSDKVERIRKLGEGGHSEVWLVEYLGQLEAHKFLTHTGAREAVFQEALYTRRVKHPNIVAVYNAGEVDGRPYLRMEYVEGSDLATLVDDEGIIPVERLLPLAIQVADALQASHECGIVHHDLKPANLLLRQERDAVLVTDFGISAALRETASRGTPRFMAPELYEPGGRGLPGSDIWSFGVTLYYLLTLSYPFPFREMEPQEAIKREPHDICETHPYVSREFRDVLFRMLRVDPEERFASMAEVMQELEHLLYGVTCPDCGRRFRLKAVRARCPNAACKETRIAALKRGLKARHGAETKLAECGFKSARSGFEEALAAFEEGSLEAEAEDARRRLASIEGLEKRLGELLDRVAAEVDAGRLVEATSVLQKARSRFSRHARVREMRQQLRDHLARVHAEVEPHVTLAMAKQDFEAARKVLNRIDTILNDKTARRELQAVLGREPQEFEQLFHDIAEKEETCARYLERATSAILKFDFRKALQVYSALENEFHSARNVDMMTRLQRAPDIHKWATKYKVAALRKVIADPARLCDRGKTYFRKVNQACRKLLNDFSVADYETFEEIAELKELTSEAMEAVRAYVDERLEKARAAQEEAHFSEEQKLIDAVYTIVTRSDPFKVQEQQYVKRRKSALETLMTRAEERYQQGCAHVERREYVQAEIAFNGVLNMIPDGYRDTKERLRGALETRKRLSEMQHAVSLELNRIERADFTPEDAVTALTKAGEYYELAEDVARTRIRQRLAGTCAGLLGSQLSHLETQGETKPERFLAVHFVPLVQALPAALWHRLFSWSGELGRTFCGVLEAAYAGDRNLADELEAAHLYRDVLEPVRDLLTELEPPLGSNHPVETIAKRVRTAFRNARKGECERSIHACIMLLRESGSLASAPAREILGVEIKALEEWQTRARWEGRIDRTRELAKRYGPYAAALVIGVLLGLLLGGSDETVRREELAQTAAGFVIKGLDTDAIVSFLKNPETRPGRLRLLGSWQELKDGPEFLALVPLRKITTGAVRKAFEEALRTATEMAIQARLREATAVVKDDPGVVQRLLVARLTAIRKKLGEVESLAADVAALVRHVERRELEPPAGVTPKTREALAAWRTAAGRAGVVLRLADIVRAAVERGMEPKEFHEAVRTQLAKLPASDPPGQNAIEAARLFSE